MSRLVTHPSMLTRSHAPWRQLAWPGPRLSASFHIGLARKACQPKSKCSQSTTAARSHDSTPTPSSSSPTELEFWKSATTWRRSTINTLRCLIGCSIGDFTSMWYLQLFHPNMDMNAIMAISMACGLSSSLLLETTLLRYGRDRLPWAAAAKTAVGMSMISMITMELAQNTVDYHLTGGVVQLDSPSFWLAALISLGAGFLTPLPYNYIRLRKYGKACH
ncbi:hypothetical protein GL218_05440 [Daldinia childiae]|uniref:uncharacterized protein n=1 Tax=Daldinia childiae TaxID=326645 RepID=UPI0014462916|nr:uncharacterized protein GL218_05440 [Daldinia childiae]KAF3058560.1 hypothetical protein GL218_05440 [Daldinia childiae]